MFRSTFEKQLDSKRRIVLPQEFRAAAAAPPRVEPSSPAPPSFADEGFDGVFCFPSIEANCLEGGGPALFNRYLGVIEELPFGDPLRSALEFSVIGGVRQLPFDSAGRIVLPESFCEQFGLTDWVAVVGSTVSKSGRSSPIAPSATPSVWRPSRAYRPCACPNARRRPQRRRARDDRSPPHPRTSGRGDRGGGWRADARRA